MKATTTTTTLLALLAMMAAPFAHPAIAEGAPATRPATPPSTRPAAARVAGEPSQHPSPEPSPEIRDLLRRLGSQRWVEREAAQQALAEVGIEAEPALRELQRSTADEDLRTRADALLARIELDRRYGPIALRLNFRDAPARAVFDEVARQSGVRFVVEDPAVWGAARPVTLVGRRLAFWPTMLVAAEAAGVGLEPDPQTDSIRVVPGPWQVRPCAAAGPLLVVPGQLYRTSTIDLGEGDAPMRTLRMELTFHADPALRVLRYSLAPRLLEATDDAGGNRLDPQADGGVDEDADSLVINSEAQPLRWTSEVELADLDRPARKLTRVRGVVRLVVPSRSDVAEVPDVMATGGAVRNVAGQRYIVQRPRVSGDNVIVPLLVSRGALPREAWRAMLQGPALMQSVRLLDAEGRRLPLESAQSAGPADPNRSQATINVTFVRPRGPDGRYLTGPASRLVIDVVTEVRTLTVPFELEDVALP